MPVLFSSRYTICERDHPRYIVLTRTETPFSDIASVDLDRIGLCASLANEPVSSLGLLCDLTRPTGRNDADFEKAIRPTRNWLFANFAEVALAVRSEVGRLQLQRHIREDRLDLPVFVGKNAARRWLERHF